MKNNFKDLHSASGQTEKYLLTVKHLPDGHQHQHHAYQQESATDWRPAHFHGKLNKRSHEFMFTSGQN